MDENKIMLLTDKQVDLFAETLDEACPMNEWIKNKLVGVTAEALDRKLAKWTINFLNIRISPFVPDKYKHKIHLAINDIQDGDKDYRVAVGNAIDLLDQLKDELKVKPWIKSLIDSFLELIKATLLAYLELKLKMK